MSAAELYDRDFYEWTVRNAELLRAGRVADADLAHIAEEIEDMGKRERRELLSRLGILLSHLLKWQAPPERRGQSWSATIRLQRREIVRLIDEMPSLKRYLAESLPKAYEEGVLGAAAETGLPVEAFPSTCPFELDAVLDVEFLP
ncbi:MAG TPA: DUF29 domain-containing protein [Bryobacteraceae bacterium]|nr:DUF29 domain-containing protein [Bryobacteraceae bacterium]